MRRITTFVLALLLYFTSFAQVTPPEDFFGFTPGADKKLFTYEKLVDYLKLVEKQSGRVKLVTIGHSMYGRPMVMVLVSSPENLKNLDKLKQINKELALNPDLSQEKLKQYTKEGKVFLLMTLSMHSNEVGPSQALPKIVYKLATTNDPQLLKAMDNVVYMAVANHNPDGMDMVVEHYNKYLGTKYEGSWLPGLYQKYVGHDDNRDFITLTQSETQAINNLFSKEWFPQVLCEKHQMGMTGPRYFVPPKHDPIAQNIDAELWNWDGVFGLNMLKDMTEAGLSGVTFNYIFDDYWPGSTETAHWKNMVAMLTEAASARYATPVYIEDNELRVSGKGLAEYAKSVKMPLPWPGGWWRLSDIVKYEETSTLSMIKTASLHKEELLMLRNRLAKKETERGKTQAPYYYVIPQDQWDQSEFVRLVKLLSEHGIKLYKTDMAFMSKDYWIMSGDIVIPLAQPFRPFIKEVMEKQTFPVRHYTTGGPMIKPYDITSWSLPLHRGITVQEINEPVASLDKHLVEIKNLDFLTKKEIPQNYKYAVFPSNNNDSYKAAFTAMKQGLEVKRTTKGTSINNDTVPAGSFVIKKSAKLKAIINELDMQPVFTNDLTVETKKIDNPKVALIETYLHDMDAGWTRYIFDNYNVDYAVIHPSEIEKTDLSKFDVIVFPDNSPEVLKEGKYSWGGSSYSKPFYPPQYTKGMGEKGLQKILKYIDNGGIIVAWGQSGKLFKGNLKFGENEEISLPFDDISKQLASKGLYIPGSLVRIELKESPVTYGLPREIGVFYRGRPVFTTSIPEYDTDRRVIAKFPKDKNRILISGYAQNEELIANRTAIVWLKKNKGQLVLMSFNPQFRSSTQGSFKLLFNSLLLEKL